MASRRATSIALAIVGALAAVFGAILAVAQRSLFDEDEVERTTAVIVADRDVKRLLAREITERAMSLGDFERFEDEVTGVVALLLADERVEVLVTRGVVASHRSLVNGADEVVEFNPIALSEQVRDQLVAFVPALDDELPPADELLRFELLRRDDLPGLYSTIETIRTGAWWVLAFGLLCIAAALVVGPGRLGLIAVASGVGVVAMFLTATWIQTASDNGIDAVDDSLSRRVARLAVDEYLADLNRVAVGVVIFGIIGVIAGIGGGWVRNTVFPSMSRPKAKAHAA